MIKMDAFLARTGGIVESLGHTTVVCAIDREGTIASTLPCVDQLFCIRPNGEPVVLDVQMDRTCSNGVKIEDADWANYTKSFKLT